MELIISEFQDVNIFHFLSLEINAIWKKVHNNPNKFSVYLKHFKDDSINMWRYDFISKLVNNVYINEIDIPNNYSIKTKLQITEWMFNSWKFINYEQSFLHCHMISHIKNKMNITNTLGNDIVLIIRKNSRVLYDSKTGSLIEDVLLKQIPNLKIVCFDNISFEDQVHIISNARIMISCHGAANTNAIFLPSNGTLIEISFRPYWHCDPVCLKHRNGILNYKKKCDECLLTYKPYYHKADYHNIAKLFGKQYIEIPLTDAEEFIDDNPINVKKIWIDSNKILDKI
jgi:hypothetical protein